MITEQHVEDHLASQIGKLSTRIYVDYMNMLHLWKKANFLNKWTGEWETTNTLRNYKDIRANEWGISYGHKSTLRPPLPPVIQKVLGKDIVDYLINNSIITIASKNDILKNERIAWNMINREWKKYKEIYIRSGIHFATYKTAWDEYRQVCIDIQVTPTKSKLSEVQSPIVHTRCMVKSARKT